MKPRSLYIIAFIIAISSGCEDSLEDAGTNGIYPGEIVPLAVGNKWTTVPTYYTDTSEVTGRPSSMVVSHDTIAYGLKWYFLGSSQPELAVGNLSCGLCFLSKPDSPHVWFKYPAQPKDSFKLTISSIYNMRVVTIDTLITVAAGTFHCYKYENNSVGYKDVYYMSPNFGFIKIELYDSSPKSGKLVLFRKYELSSFVINRSG